MILTKFLKNGLKVFSSIAVALFILSGVIPLAFSQTVCEEAQRHFSRGMAAVEMAKTEGDYEDAIREFEQAIRLAPNFTNAYYNLGMVQEKVGKYDEAIRNLRKYLELNPSASDREAVLQLIYKAEFKKEKSLDPKSLAGIWVPEGDVYEHYRFEIRNNRGRVEARVLPNKGWRVPESGPKHAIPDGAFVPIEWDGKNLKIVRATGYGCHQSVSINNCPYEISYFLKRVSEDVLEGEYQFRGNVRTAGGWKWYEFSNRRTYIRKNK